jgi:hypothetical protein
MLRHLVHGIGVAVVEFSDRVKSRAHSTVFGVNDVHCGDIDRGKRLMIVNDVGVVPEEVRRLSESISGLGNVVL